ncbi:helix-turn-helix domain-containing protein [Streptomyces lichenis]|uniref:Helix-turn-helix domain-containing protein n=1 Tax=Streptomyces lichenis TaxID=2306967 RepID=A0ABT0IHD8_9ACTN|nr:helix-turn-helix transcriptional regulator [Streptomyces lichenis]MCK8680743.1 helix-turn-helix domain-containing protein [Streptomyces lichenis]
MPNERLRAAMAARGWTHAGLAARVDVDPKSVERWVNLGRVPRRGTAFRVAEAIGEDVYALWPALRQARAARAVSPELVGLFEQRAELPVSAFADLFSQAVEHIDVLVYAAVFLHESYPRLNEVLRERAAEGCSVRIAVGDADSPNVRQRGEEERFGHGIEGRCRLAMEHYRPLLGVDRVELRIHGTTLYNSLYRADDQLLVNAHVWGTNAYRAPVWHLRRCDKGGLFDTYAESFDAVWRTATPMEGHAER